MSTSDKLLSVLGIFTEDASDWSVDEAAQKLELNKSTAYRYFNALTSAGYLVPFQTGRYILGPEIIRLDRQLRRADPLIAVADAEMQKLARLQPGKITIVLARLFGETVMCVHQVSASTPDLGVSFERGRPMPLYAGSVSRIILANLPTRRLKQMFARNPSPFNAHDYGQTWQEVLGTVKTLRAAGYCVSTGEVDAALRGVSVPVFDKANQLLGSLTAVGLAETVEGDLLAELPLKLKQSATRIAHGLA